MNHTSPPVILPPSHFPSSLIRMVLLNLSQRAFDIRQKFDTNIDCNITLILEVQNSLMGIEVLYPRCCWWMRGTFTWKPCRQITMKKINMVPQKDIRLGLEDLVKAMQMAPHLLGLVSRQCVRQMKEPSNSIPYSEERVTGLNRLQKMFSEVLATMNSEIPDTSPQSCLSRLSSRMTMIPANNSCTTISAILNQPICEGGPYAPDQICPAASPKVKMRARVFSKPSMIFFSLSVLTRISPMEVTICVIHPAEMMGPIPNYMSVPRLEARMTLVQYRASALWDLFTPQRGIWQQIRQMNRVMAVQAVFMLILGLTAGRATSGTSLDRGSRVITRLNPIEFAGFYNCIIVNTYYGLNLKSRQNQYQPIFVSFQIFLPMGNPILYFYTRQS